MSRSPGLRTGGMENKGKVLLAAVGDLALTHSYNSLYSQKGEDFPFGKVKGLLRKHDIVFGNLEAPLCRDGDTYPMKCSLRGDPVYAKGLKDAGFTILSVSNNHIFDYKEAGFSETRKWLEQQGIRYFGAGENLADARTPAILSKNDVRIGFLGYCDVVIDSPFYAATSERGIAPLNLAWAKEDITELRGKVDVIVVSLHWGIENWSYPSPRQIQIAHSIIDYGCDLVLGHHPHVIQGIERYKHGYVAYSLGNFAFSEIEWSWQRSDGSIAKSFVPLRRRNREGMILLARLSRDGIESVEAIPTLISMEYEIEILSNNSRFRKKIHKLSGPITGKNYEKFWQRYSLTRRYQEIIAYNLGRLKRIHKIRPHHVKELIELLKGLANIPRYPHV